MTPFEEFQARVRASERVIAESDLYYRAVQNSPPDLLASHNNGERDPSVMPDWAGGDTQSPQEMTGERQDG